MRYPQMTHPGTAKGFGGMTAVLSMTLELAHSTLSPDHVAVVKNGQNRL